TEDTVRPVPAVLGASARLVTPYRTEGHENLAIDVGQRIRSADRRLLNADEKPTVGVEGDDLVLELPLRILMVQDATPTVILAKAQESVEVEAAFKPGGSDPSERPAASGTLTCTVPRARLTPGDWRVRVRFSAGGGRPAELPLHLTIPAEGEPPLEPARARPPRRKSGPGGEPKRRWGGVVPLRGARGLAGRLYRVARNVRRRIRRGMTR